jgi:hypothetical protein
MLSLTAAAVAAQVPDIHDEASQTRGKCGGHWTV